MKRSIEAANEPYWPQAIRSGIIAGCILFFLFSTGYAANWSGDYQGMLNSYNGSNTPFSASISQSGTDLAGTVTIIYADGNLTLPLTGSVATGTNVPHFSASGQTANGLFFQLNCHTLGLGGDHLFGFYNIQINGGIVEMGQFGANRPTTYWALSVTKTGLGTGFITSPSGIGCPGTCSASIQSGTQVTLTATAGPCATFGGWSGACSGVSNTCTVTMDDAKSVSAQFSLNTSIYPLLVLKSGSGTVTGNGGINCGSTCYMQYTCGTQVTLTASLNPGSLFGGWGGACQNVGGATCVITIDGAKQVSSNFIASGADTASFMYGGFGSPGLWMWDGSVWGKLTTSNPDSMVASGSILYGAFGTAGVWRWDGSSWMQLSPTYAQSMVASGSSLYVDFGPAGLWRWNGTSWTRLTPSDPEIMVASESALYAVFGVAGLWTWDGTAWAQLSPSRAESLVHSGSYLYSAFGPAGVWMWDGSSWTQLTPSAAQSIVSTGTDLVGDFGLAGVWRWSTSTGWLQLSPTVARSMLGSSSVLYVNFGPAGLWRWNGSAWSQLTQSNPQNMVASGALLYGNFGLDGLWRWNGTAWMQLSPNGPPTIAVPSP